MKFPAFNNLFLVLLFTLSIFSVQSVYSCEDEFTVPPRVHSFPKIEGVFIKNPPGTEVFGELVENWHERYWLLTPARRAVLDTFVSLKPYYIYDEHTFMQAYIKRRSEITGKKIVTFDNYIEHFESLEATFRIALSEIKTQLGLDAIAHIFQAKSLSKGNLGFRYTPTPPTFEILVNLPGSIFSEEAGVISNPKHLWAFYQGEVIELSGHFNRKNYLLLAELIKPGNPTLAKERIISITQNPGTLPRPKIEMMRLRDRFRKVDPDFNKIKFSRYRNGYYWALD